MHQIARTGLCLEKTQRKTPHYTGHREPPESIQVPDSIFSRFLGFDGFDWYLQRFAAKLSDLHGVVVVVVGWMDGWMVGWLVS